MKTYIKLMIIVETKGIQIIRETTLTTNSLPTWNCIHLLTASYMCSFCILYNEIKSQIISNNAEHNMKSMKYWNIIYKQIHNLNGKHQISTWKSGISTSDVHIIEILKTHLLVCVKVYCALLQFGVDVLGFSCLSLLPPLDSHDLVHGHMI